MSIVSDSYLRDAERLIKRELKRAAKPELAGRFFAIWFKPQFEPTEPHDIPPKFRKQIVYAESKDEADAAIRTRNGDRVEIRPHAKVLPYSLAISEFTNRTGSLIGLLHRDCLMRLLGDFRRWHQARPKIELEPPKNEFHRRLEFAVEQKTPSE